MKKQSILPILILIGGSIPGTIILADFYGVPTQTIVVLTVILSLIFGWLALWNYANSHAKGDEWWQDDNCSGWRGY